jgi:D-alanyl-D-alanine carboxypeptidase
MEGGKSMDNQKSNRTASIAAVAFFACVCIAGYIWILSVICPAETAAAFHQSSSSPVVFSASSPAPSTAKVLKTEISSGQSAHARELVVVNQDNPVPSWYALNLTDAFGVKMDAEAAAAFTEMRTQASKDEVTLWISSAYRSNELQNKLFQQEVENFTKTCPTYAEAVASAEHSVAKPGYSEHETGLALDLNGVRSDFDSTPAFRWLSLHAQDYGFILRYPKNKEEITKIEYEPWHYRYVGIENAKAIKKSGLCLEEYAAQKTDTIH